MNRVIMFMIVSGILLTAIYAIRYLRVIPNYQKEYLVQFSPVIKMSVSSIEDIDGIYDVHQINDTQFRIHFDAPMEKLQELLLNHFTLNSNDVKVKQLHSWLKTNAWK